MNGNHHNVAVSVFAYTDVGRQRSGNEDAFLVADLTTGKVGLRPDMTTHTLGERGSLLIVSDGMGGAAAGEVASDLTVQTLRQSLLDMPTDLDAYARLKLATEVANEVIWNEAQRNTALAGMGATLTAALVQKSAAHIAQVGDSRAYLIRGRQIKQITKDQSYAQMLVDSGVITPEQMDAVPKHVIAQALGTQPAIEVALTSVELCRKDYLILCSDGLSGKLQAEEIRRLVLESADLGVACRRLVDLANERGGEDNITVVIAGFDGAGLAQAGDDTPITESFRTIDPARLGEARQTRERHSPAVQGKADASADDNQPAAAPARIDSGTIPLASATPPAPTPQKLAVQASSTAAATAPQSPEPLAADSLSADDIITARLPQPPTQALRSGENPFAANLEAGFEPQVAAPPPAKSSYRTAIIMAIAFLFLLLLLTAGFVFSRYIFPRLE